MFYDFFKKTACSLCIYMISLKDKYLVISVPIAHQLCTWSKNHNNTPRTPSSFQYEVYFIINSFVLELAAWWKDPSSHHLFKFITNREACRGVGLLYTRIRLGLMLKRLNNWKITRQKDSVFGWRNRHCHRLNCVPLNSNHRDLRRWL